MGNGLNQWLGKFCSITYQMSFKPHIARKQTCCQLWRIISYSSMKCIVEEWRITTEMSQKGIRGPEHYVDIVWTHAHQFGQQAGLFSVVTPVSIIKVHSQPQKDPNKETAALLCVLICNMDNNIFSDNVPQWTGPPRTIIQIQPVTLFTGLAPSPFSAFLAVLGKQWLNPYTWVMGQINKENSTVVFWNVSFCTPVPHHLGQ